MMTNEEIVFEIENDYLLSELKNYSQVTEDDLFYIWILVAEENLKKGEYYLATKYCNKIINHTEEDVYSHIGERCYSYILMAQLYSEDDNSLSACYDMLQKAENILFEIEDDELQGVLFLEWSLTSSKINCDLGNVDLFELHSKNVYTWCRDRECFDEHYLAAINNLTLAYYQQGRVKDGKNIIIEALDYICLNDIHNTDMVRCIFLTWLYVGCGEYTDRNEICEKRFQNYLKRLQIVVNDIEDDEIKVNYLFFQSHFYYYMDKIDEARNIMIQAINLEKNISQYMNNLFDYVIDNIFVVQHLLSEDELKDILFCLVKTIPDRLNQNIQIKDNIMILRLLARYNRLVMFILSFVNSHKIICSDVELFEVVGNCKDLYSDVLHARKLVKNGNPQNQFKYNEVDDLHREIIKRQVGSFFQHIDNDDYEEIIRKKRQLESQLVENYDCIDFHWMNYQELINRLPDESVYIDYIQYPNTIRKEQYLGDLQYCVISVMKSDGQVSINTYPSINLIFVRAQFMLMTGYVRTKKGKEAKSQIENLFVKEKDVYWNLYMILLKPILDKIPKKVSKLYISGDVEINGFPFALFLNEKGSYLIDSFKISYLNSIRNIGEETWIELNTINDAKILGNPLFSCIRNSEKCSMDNVLLPLPFSKIEANIVSQVLKTVPYLREKAKKSVIDDENCQLLHIATHGAFFDIEEGHEEQMIVSSLNRSCFYLAGANDWIFTQNEYSDCGTGIVTAEEFLIYNYPKMQLIVLSSCFSGVGDISYSQGLLGLRTALLAQGIKNIIISLWEVDDLASAILMKRFYENLEKYSVSDSLREAQLYLRNVSIGELIENGWFDENLIKKVGLVSDEMRKLRDLPPETRNFELPKYWAGFILIQQ